MSTFAGGLKLKLNVHNSWNLVTSFNGPKVPPFYQRKSGRKGTDLKKPLLDGNLFYFILSFYQTAKRAVKVLILADYITLHLILSICPAFVFGWHSEGADFHRATSGFAAPPLP